MKKLRIVFAGSGEFGGPTLRALADGGHELVSVITQPDRPAGRGRGLIGTPIAQQAADMGLPVMRTPQINSEALPPSDLMIVIAFGQKISAQKVNEPRLGSVNLHASRLPSYRGAAPINWAILNGEAVTGNSVIRLADRMDAGAVLAQSTVAVGDTETAGELHDRLALDGVALVLSVVQQLAEGTAVEVPQDETAASIAPKLSRASARLDFTRPAAELAQTIRGLYPWPGCRVRLLDAEGREVGRLRPIRALRRSGSEATHRPGEIAATGAIQAGEGMLEIIECQPDGGRAMSFDDYRRGHPWAPGMRVEAVD